MSAGSRSRENRVRIFVTGATGVVGSRLLPILLSQGHVVTAGIRPGSPSRRGLAGVAVAEIDLFDAAALKKAFAGHEAVVNLATHIPSSAWKMVFRGAWRLNDRIRTEGAANVAAAAQAVGATRLIQESFAPAYPDCGDRWVGEETPLRPTAYNRTVLDAERAAAGFTGSGRAGIALRFAGFYGPDAVQMRSYVDALRKGWAPLPGGPERYISSIAHDDAATAVAATLAAPAGVYNVGDDEPVTRAEFFGSLAEALGVKPPRLLPDWATPLFGSLGRTLSRSLRMSNRKLREATGWAPKYPSVREGWPATLAEMNSG
jgi:nucleoside-diphosphate-sugar epimerase